MTNILSLLLRIPGIILATTVHEFIRAFVSTILGDKKPKQDRRLTLNPVKHFEPIGFILMFAKGCGWGKPVDTSSLWYKNRKRDTLITAIAPSVINILLAFLLSLLSNVSVIQSNTVLLSLVTFGVYFNVSIAVYNIVPVAPFDGTKVLAAVLPANTYFKYLQYEKTFQMVFLFLLFLGYAEIIFSPIISGVVSFISGFAYGFFI